MGTKIKLDNVRLSFEHLYKPSAYQNDPTVTPKYSGVFMFAKGSDTEKQLRAAIAGVAKEAWKNKASAMLTRLDGSNNTRVIHDGDVERDIDKYPEYAGQLYINPKNKVRPTIVNRNAQPVDENSIQHPYSGCYCNVYVDVWAMSKGTSQRVNLTLLGVQFYKNGEKFTAGADVSKASDFEDLGDDPDEQVEAPWGAQTVGGYGSMNGAENQPADDLL